MSDFWLNEAEKTEFKKSVENLQNADSHIEQAEHRAEVEDISVNKDGSYSRKSRAGKEIEATLEKYRPISEMLSADVRDLQQLPLSRWKKYNDYIRYSRASLWALLAWGAVLTCYLITSEKDPYQQLVEPYVNLCTDWDSLGASGDVDMIAYATGAALICFFVFRLVSRNAAARYSPRPNEVTPENVDNPG
jgi:hypothetical protein